MATGLSVDMGGDDIHCNALYVGATGPGQAGTSITTTEGATTINVGASGTAGTLNVFPSTASKGTLTVTATNNTGNTTTTLTNAAMGQASVISIPDPGGATANVVLTQGTQTIAGATTLSSVPNATFSAGTTSIAPINLTSGTNLTTATAGAVEFDGNAFYATSQASSRQMVDAEQYIIQATEPAGDNNGGLDSASAAAFFTAGSGTITLVAGKTYFFEACLNLTNSGTTAHTWATVLGGTATFTATGTQYQVTGNSSGTANAAATGGLSGFISGSSMSTAVVCTPSSTSATEQVTIQMTGTLVVNAGGTLIPQLKASARPGASGTPGVVHKAGSFFRIWQAPTLGTVGNWS